MFVRSFVRLFDRLNRPVLELTRGLLAGRFFSPSLPQIFRVAQFFQYFTLSEDQQQKLSEMKCLRSGTILECVYDHQWKTWRPSNNKGTWEEGQWDEGGWVYQRVRDDKSMANDKRVVEKIWQSITDRVEAEEVVQAIEASRT